MKKKFIFLGNSGDLIYEILKLKDFNLIGVVADEVSDEMRKYFGSSFLVAKKENVPCVSQRAFNENYKEILKKQFKDADLIYVHGYRYRIKNDLINNQKLKIINFHQSLLPKYAGRHPLNWVIIRGEKETGITFHYVKDDFDTGDIILQKRIRISKNDDVISLYNKTIKSGSASLKTVLRLAYDKDFTPKKQNLSKRTYLPPRRPEDSEISKRDTIEGIKNKIRALVFPYPGSFININGRKIIIRKVYKLKESKKYKDIKFAEDINGQIIIRAKDGLLKVCNKNIENEKI